MPKETVEVLVEGGKATAAPPLGPALGPMGVNIGQVVAEINKATADLKGMSVPVKVIIADDKSFRVEVGTPPTSGLLKKEAGIQKGSGKQGEEVSGNLTIEQIVKVAKVKKKSVLSKDLKSTVKEVIGTARTLGLTIEGLSPKEATEAINSGRWADKFKEG